ncbi:MAG TPA: hypothetical protein PL110_01900 [Candidatus Eremiobacteraeota bacterium]|nr:MAG: hypothetical protein BWY64_00554 [bacterium ADurb.Bin363]HPZ06843.1 hypothetical protein [Candidatus Eremiobacteraeota bacterium]
MRTHTEFYLALHKGIKCGSSLEEVIKKYKENYFKEDFLGSKSFNLSYLHLGILFVIRDEKVVSISVF